MQEDNIVYLTDDEGREVAFQQLDLVELKGDRYVILAALEGDDEGGLLIFRLQDDDYEQVTDESMLQLVYDTFVSSDEDYEFYDAE